MILARLGLLGTYRCRGDGVPDAERREAWADRFGEAESSILGATEI